MADAVTSATLVSNCTRVVKVFTNVSDGTGESAVQKVDISGLTGTPTAVKINRVIYDCSGMQVRVLFDHTTDDTALVLSGNGELDFTPYGGLKDPASDGGTGDILFTTIGHTSGDSYTIILDIGI